MGEAPADERRSTETSSDSPTKPRDTEARFATTRWSLVASVRDEDPLRARAALSELCENYWPPIYAYLRRRGHSTHEAQDLTQSFVVELLERDLLGRADADRGKFRSFLLGACQHFLSHERERAAAKKRGGHRQTLRLDFAR
ncbi:MAG: sigma-70 family RNA polymerase sigma factor, partial [Planctomycetes bacterium]|nr:sigma-70 family RNA polymerase sigma factor [Planctomycetota bacterium]